MPASPSSSSTASRDKAEAVSDRYGARVADTARDAANSGDVVLVSLADDAAVLGTYEGDAGLLAGIRDGAVLCDTSTVDPETMRQLAPLVAARGATLLDTPVSGSVPLVERGELTVMVGGDAGALRARTAGAARTSPPGSSTSATPAPARR